MVHEEYAKKGGDHIHLSGCGDISLEVGWHMIIIHCLRLESRV